MLKKKAAAKANAAYLGSHMLISGMTTEEIENKEAFWSLSKNNVEALCTQQCVALLSYTRPATSLPL